MTQGKTGPILIYLGANAHSSLENQLLSIDKDLRFLQSSIYPERVDRIGEEQKKRTIFFDNELISSDNYFKSVVSHYQNDLELIERLMNDKLLNLLWTRFSRRIRWHNISEVKRYELHYSIINSAIKTCREVNPSSIIFSYEPHNLPMYIFKKVCETMGYETNTLVISPFSWRLFKDHVNSKKEDHFIQQNKNKPQIHHEEVKKMIMEKRSDYDIAKPFYEKRLKKGSKLNRFLFRLKTSGWRLLSSIQGEILLYEYNKHVEKRSKFKEKKYVCFFMQLQPEQTTLPDGDLFVSHILAIQMLYSVVKKLNMHLVVREHPASFDAAYDSTWRPKNFYAQIKNIGNDIFFDDTNEEPYKLISQSSGVSSITGTVLLEGLLQGKPAIAFGKHPLKFYSEKGLVDNFINEDELTGKIKDAKELSSQQIAADTELYLHSIYDQTFGASEYIGNNNMTLELLREARYESIKELIKLKSANN